MSKSQLRTKPILRIACITAISLVLSGCGRLFSGTGPAKRQIFTQAQKESANYTLVSLAPENILPYMRPPEPELKADISKTGVPDLRLTSGDVLRVMISDDDHRDAVFSSLTSGGTVFDKVRVNASGHISLPYVGRVKVVGLSLEQAQDEILQQLRPYALKPQVYVSLVGDMGGSVLVAGDVHRPGRFSTLEGPLTVLDAINQAGGPRNEPYLMNVVVRNGTSVESYNYQALLNGLNFPVAPNTEIVLERASKRFVALGAVGQPGLHDLPSQSPSLLEVLGSVGGLVEQRADARGVFVFRVPENIVYDEKLGIVTSDAKPMVFHLDMSNPVSMFLAREFLIYPDDAVYVTNAHMYESQKMISSIVQVLVLGSTIDQL